MQPLAFVDLETTGATASVDRITEIGIVEVDDAGVREWSSLVDPGTPVPPFIQAMTGITDKMLRGAPSFAKLAGEVQARLQGRIFIAHNARFDYGFLKEEFQRTGYTFRATVLCTVKLSRKLNPEQRRHGLDALIERHGLEVDARHRALADARLIHQFWEQMRRQDPQQRFAAAVDELLARPNLPPLIDPSLVDELPEAPGVYVFYGAADLPLYVGRAGDLRQRVLAQFARKPASARQRALFEQLCRVDWIVTGGEIGARLKEVSLLQALQPKHNSRQRRPALSRPAPEFANWPFCGPAYLREGDEILVVDRWRYLGAARSEEEIWALLEQGAPPFDCASAKILFNAGAKLRPLRPRSS